MDCSSDDMGYQKRGRTRSHELNMVVIELLGRVIGSVCVCVVCSKLENDLVRG